MDQGIYDATLSPDGRHFAASVNGMLRLYDAASGEKTRDLARGLDETEFTVQNDALRFSPDGKFLFARYPATTGRFGNLWAVETGQDVAWFNDIVMGSQSAFSPDGKYLVTASEGTSYLWDAHTGERVREFRGSPGTVGGVAFSPDGMYVATTREKDDRASLWLTETGGEIRTFVGHTAGVEGVDFAPDGKQLVTASRDQTVRIWDIATGKELRQLQGHTAPVRFVKFSPDGKLILSGGEDGTARLWEVASGKQVREFSGQGRATSLGFFPDGKRIYVVGDDKTIRVWRIDMEEVMKLACARLPRELDRTEIQEYHISDYAPVCSKK